MNKSPIDDIDMDAPICFHVFDEVPPPIMINKTIVGDIELNDRQLGLYMRCVFCIKSGQSINNFIHDEQYIEEDLKFLQDKKLITYEYKEDIGTIIRLYGEQ